jgi:hypothetical protein
LAQSGRPDPEAVVHKREILTTIKRSRIGFTAAIILGFVPLLLACTPEEPIKVEEGKPFPACRATGKVFSRQELIDIAVQFLNDRHMKRCVDTYRSPADFYKQNPDCCVLDINRNQVSQPIRDRYLGKIGDLVGSIRVGRYCGSSNPDVGMYRYGSVDITTCGVIAESSSSHISKEYFDNLFKSKNGSKP